MPPRRDYSRANYDEIRAKLNEIDWAVKFRDKLSDKSGGVSEAASHREENAENDLWSDVEG